MKLLRDKLLHATYQGTYNKRKILVIVLVLFCVLMLDLFLLPDFLPLFRNPSLVLRSLRHIVRNKKSVSVFPITAKQNVNTLVDKSIPSTGCGTSLSIDQGHATYMETASAENTKRRFVVYLPPHYENKTPHALILVFHGYGGNPFTLGKATQIDHLANDKNIIIIYPEGTRSLAQVRGWNTGLHPTITANDVLFVSNLLNELQSNLCINPNQIYATGFSNGGGFVALLACQLSNRIAAFAPIAGSYVTAFNTCKATRPVPIIEFHGSKDSVVPYLGVAARKELGAFTWTQNWAERNKCSQEPKVINEKDTITQYIWTNCSDNASVIHYKIVGEGHTWPRLIMKQQFKSRTEELNTANVIWNFFKQHPLKNKQQLRTPLLEFI